MSHAVTAQHAVTLATSFNLNRNFLSPIAQGILQGSVYGLIGLGLVLVYKANRVFNFAQGEFGSVAALVTNAGIGGSLFGLHLSYPVAAIIGVSAGTTAAVATERLVIRPLFDRPKIILTVGTVGVTLLLIAIETLAIPQGKQFPAITDHIKSLSAKPYWFQLFGTSVTYQQVLCLAVLAVLAVATALFFKRTSTGTAILAVSQEPVAASVVGISVGRISLITWGLAGFLGSVAGVVLGPIVSPIAPGFVTGTALFTGFTAAVLGGITSLQGAFVGGLAIGVIEKLASTENLQAFGLPQIPGADTVIIALTLLLVLLIRPTGIFGKEV